ncbi:DUF6090 family protein [Flavobacteriaceae bacterium S0862]|nr:DUF6090 family protein [Flavobacteriaceae bacterium S0862]
MIKFFRRIRYDLMKKNKTGKYFKYAIGEIILVMVGILLALQVNNWNEQRKMNSQEQELLDGLEVEFTINFNRLENVLQLHQNSIDSANKIMTYFNTDISDIPEVKFDSLQFHIQNVWTFNPRKGLLNSVITSGQINLISNVELKNQLASFEDMVNDMEQEIQEISLLGTQFYSTTSEYINIGKQNALGYKTFVNEGFQSDYDRFFKDFRVYNYINNETTWSYDLLGEEIELMRSIKRILELIKQELN